MNKFIKKLLAMRIFFSFVDAPSDKVNNTVLENYTNYIPEPHPMDVNSIKCEFCENLISILERRLNLANETITDIEKVIERICSLLLSKPKREVCYNVDNDIDEIKNMIIGGLDRKEICYKMGLCK